MTATEELRRMLDERGVEYEGGERSVRWRDRNGVMMQAFQLANGELGMDVWSCTPEQAIAATVGNADLAAENAKLREELEQWHKLTAGIELPKYPVTEFHPKDLERENAELRKLVRWMYDRMDESCAVQHPYAPAPINYYQLMQAATRAHKLGVEVDE